MQEARAAGASKAAAARRRSSDRALCSSPSQRQARTKEEVMCRRPRQRERVRQPEGLVLCQVLGLKTACSALVGRSEKEEATKQIAVMQHLLHLQQAMQQARCVDEAARAGS